MIVLATQDYKKQISGRSTGQLYKFKSESKGLNGQLALIKDIQVEPIHDLVLHMDFLLVDEKKPIRVQVALEVVGECPAVKLGEALLNLSVHELEIMTLPTKIPSRLTVDVSGLTIGHSIHAGEVVLPEGAKLMTDPDLSVVSAMIKKAEEELPTAVVPEADAAAAAAAGAAGAAPAAGAAGAKAPGAAGGKAAAAPAADKGKAAPAAKK